MVDKLNYINNNFKCKSIKQFYQKGEIKRIKKRQYSAYAISMRHTLDSKIQIDGKLKNRKKDIYHANSI